ncbi:sialic acid-specific 9-O-acetylesterase [Formosa agariphila KMM 3901]|uniref:Sialic acid-specific 9-O-acetylesterase n=1 Tax=Formosa agariphila (strain DSM 15362 / KCTC 12365 / LMG 23005 / KMM 3901 / M-2Alg 35-1) TaxID=1347342 RepID=T2KL42_FORAG|nr:sialate O-acetylesterase [Formosa agariphila]CDF78714.1 sialic acid-specific 9-O-acetylesterase [Formosa agariphila KMM 3901]
MKPFVSVVFLFVFTQSVFAFELTLPSIFADHMVLQRSQKVPVWGITEPHANVEVMFAGQKKRVKADASGNWKVELNPLKASSISETMIISSILNDEHSQIKINDVLVGEVWFCSGQSNMYRPFRMLIGEAVESKYEPIAEFLRQEALSANDPLFRQYKVGRDFSVFEEKTQGRGDWSKAIPNEVNEFSGTAYFFGKELRRELNVPVAIISCNLGATKIEPWMPKQAFKENKVLKDFYDNEIKIYKEKLDVWDEAEAQKEYNILLEAWELSVAQAKLKNKQRPSKPKKIEHPSRDKQIPATLFNAMINPLIPYAIKGAIWYQGESNTGNSPETYGLRLTAMVENWRSAWGQGDFYFYCCQLANYKAPNNEPMEHAEGWVLVSNGQQEILELPNTGLAVLNDIGEAQDIHPKNKVDVGKRLSLWAFKQAYNKDVVCSGPIYKQSTIQKDKIIIEFNHVGSGLMVGKKILMKPTIEVDEPLKRFQICGENRAWKWAQAKIIGNNRVAVWHKDIPNPVEVRYAWSSNPEGANLYNKEGLPASLFKTVN